MTKNIYENGDHRFHITKNMGIPIIQVYRNNRWVFARWPSQQEISEEKVNPKIDVIDANPNPLVPDNFDLEISHLQEYGQGDKELVTTLGLWNDCGRRCCCRYY